VADLFWDCLEIARSQRRGEMQRRYLFCLIVVVVIIGVSPSFLWAEENSKININTAPAKELMQLKGVGPKKAAAIIEFRETRGLFDKPEDIVKVSGIGPKTFEANKERITVKME
jgi:competence protein ComEA